MLPVIARKPPVSQPNHRHKRAHSTRSHYDQRQTIIDGNFQIVASSSFKLEYSRYRINNSRVGQYSMHFSSMVTMI